MPSQVPKRKQKSPFGARIDAAKVTERLYSGYDSPDLTKYGREHQQEILA